MIAQVYQWLEATLSAAIPELSYVDYYTHQSDSDDDDRLVWITPCCLIEFLPQRWEQGQQGVQQCSLEFVVHVVTETIEQGRDRILSQAAEHLQLAQRVYQALQGKSARLSEVAGFEGLAPGADFVLLNTIQREAQETSHEQSRFMITTVQFKTLVRDYSVNPLVRAEASGPRHRGAPRRPGGLTAAADPLPSQYTHISYRPSVSRKRKTTRSRYDAVRRAFDQHYNVNEKRWDVAVRRTAEETHYSEASVEWILRQPVGKDASPSPSPPTIQTHLHMSKYSQGQRVFIKELRQVGTYVEASPETGGKPMVRVETPDGPKHIDFIERNYELIVGIGKVLYMLLRFLTGR